MSQALVVLVTVATRAHAEHLGETLVAESLAACVNIVGPIHSIYRWQGEISRDEEYLLLIKTTAPRYAALEARVRAVHTYDVPEVIALPVERVSQAYLDWLLASTAGE